MRLASPSHNSFIELGKSIQMQTDSNNQHLISGEAKFTVLGATNEFFGGAKGAQTIGLQTETFVGGKHETLVGAKVTLNAAKEINKNALDRDRISSGHIFYGSDTYISLMAPGSMIMLDKKGALVTAGSSKIEIKKGGDITLHTGKKVKIEASGGVILDAPDCTIKAKTTVKKFFKTPNIKDPG